MKNDMPSGYPQGAAGPDSESGPVDAAAPDGAIEKPPTANPDDGPLSPGSTADGSPTSGIGSEKSVEATADGVPDPEADDARPDSLVDGNRVGTAEDME